MTAGRGNGQLDIEVSFLSRRWLGKGLDPGLQGQYPSTNASRRPTCPYRSVIPDPSSTSINIESLPYFSSRYFPNARAPCHIAYVSTVDEKGKGEGVYHLAAAFLVESVCEDDCSSGFESTFDQELYGGPISRSDTYLAKDKAKSPHDRYQPGLIVRSTAAPDIGAVVVSRERGIGPVEYGGSFDGDDIYRAIVVSSLVQGVGEERGRTLMRREHQRLQRGVRTGPFVCEAVGVYFLH
jgi:hypothetical protein